MPAKEGRVALLLLPCQRALLWGSLNTRSGEMEANDHLSEIGPVHTHPLTELHCRASILWKLDRIFGRSKRGRLPAHPGTQSQGLRSGIWNKCVPKRHE